jgi:glycosyltransferase involved in cell wall biosynthesis
MLKLSIFVACLNSERTIARTIESIELQTYKNIEVIFVDGGSTDKTTTIITNSKITSKILITEEERGISKAWNQCLKIATGDIITILNSDDYYPRDVIGPIMEFFKKCDYEQPLIGYGNTNFVNKNNVFISTKYGKYPTDLRLLFGFPFMHPSVFATKATYETVGFFDPLKMVAMDTDWLLRAKEKGIKFINIKSEVNMENAGHSVIKKFSGMGEYLDSLGARGYSNLFITSFLFLRFLGSLYNLIRQN